jgi:L-iditol 2-dehydrogenase
MLFGHEVAGIVAEVGAGVKEFRVGDRVAAMNSAPCGECYFCGKGQPNICPNIIFNNGAYAEYMKIPARIVEKNMLRVPEGMKFEHAALTEPLACVIRGLEESGAQAGDSMIVIGAGPIGLLFLHAAALTGVHVIAVVKRDDQVAAAKKFGAEHVVQMTKVDDVVATARALTPDGRGADIVIEAVAVPETWEQAVEMVRKGGVVNFFGGPASGTKVSLDTNRLHYGDITLKASFHHTPSTCRKAFALLQSGRFQCEEFLTGRARLEDLPKVFAAMVTRSADGRVDIKTVIEP